MGAKKAIVIGATSGMGMETAKLLAEEGYEVGLAGRREDRLLALRKELPTAAHIKRIDVAAPEEAVSAFETLVEEMGGLDVAVICSGIVRPNVELDWEKEQETVDTNVLGFAAMASAAARRFIKQGHGHLVGLSSTSALVYSDRSNAYCASKAFVSNYLRGLRILLAKASPDIFVTEVLPGWVYTEMTQNADKSKIFWASTAAQAASRVCDAIRKRKRKIYISRRWRLLAWMLALLPERMRVK
jgi:short-subunit dehydrogenase